MTPTYVIRSATNREFFLGWTWPDVIGEPKKFGFVGKERAKRFSLPADAACVMDEVRQSHPLAKPMEIVDDDTGEAIA